MFIEIERVETSEIGTQMESKKKKKHKLIELLQCEKSVSGHGKSALERLVAADEAARVHKHTRVDAAQTTQLLVAHALPLGRQRQAVRERVLALRHALNHPRAVRAVRINHVLDRIAVARSRAQLELLFQVEQVRFPRHLLRELHDRTTRIDL